MYDFSGPVEAVISLYEEGKDISAITRVVRNSRGFGRRDWQAWKTIHYLEIYTYLKAIGQYHVPADVELFRGDIQSNRAEINLQGGTIASADTEEYEQEDESDEETEELEEDEEIEEPEEDDEAEESDEDDEAEEPEEDDETEELEEDEEIEEQPRIVRRPPSCALMIETPLMKKFLKWLPKHVSHNAFSSYKTGLRKVLDDAQMDFDDFAPLAETVLIDYYAGGAKANVGDQSSGAARASVRKLAEFMKTQEPKKEAPIRTTPKKAVAKKEVAKKPAQKVKEDKPKAAVPEKKTSSSKLKKTKVQEVAEVEEPPKTVSQRKNPDREEVLPKLDKKTEQKIVADPSKSFNALKKAVLVIAKGIGKALFISGNGGIGKTYAVSDVLERYGHKRYKGYNILKTVTTPVSAYEFLYNNRNKICVIDDCDSILRDANGRSVLKSALDSGDVREVFWNSKGPDIVNTRNCRDNDEVAECLERWSKKHGDRPGVPNHFFFNGSVIIISNMKKSEIKKLDEALVTRARSIEVLLTNQQILDRLKELLKTFKITDRDGRDITEYAMKKKVYDWISSDEFLNDQRMEGKSINFRLFINIYLDLYANDDGSDDWKQAAF